MKNLIFIAIIICIAVSAPNLYSQGAVAGLPYEQVQSTEYDIVVDKIADFVGSEKLAGDIIVLSWRQTTLFYEQLNRLETKNLECLKDILINMMDSECFVEVQSLNGPVMRYSGIEYINSISRKRNSNTNFNISISPYIEIDTSGILFARFEEGGESNTYLFQFPIIVTQYYQRGNYEDITKKEVVFSLVLNFSRLKQLEGKIRFVRVKEVMPYN